MLSIIYILEILQYLNLSTLTRKILHNLILISK